MAVRVGVTVGVRVGAFEFGLLVCEKQAESTAVPVLRLVQGWGEARGLILLCVWGGAWCEG